MRWQRTMFQTKKQDKTPEAELSEVNRQSTQETVQSNDHKDDQITQEENGCTEQEVRFFNKEWENIKNNKTEMKSTITEMKNMLEGINNRLHDTEEWISDWKTA